MKAPIVWFADMPADFHNREPWHKIAGLRAAGHRVLFVDALGVADPRPRNLGKVLRYLARRARGRRGRSGDPDVPMLQLLIAPPRHRRLTNALNDRLLARQLRRRLATLGFERPILWFRFPTPELVRLVGRLGERSVVYECVDRYSAFGYPPRATRALVRAERHLMESAELTVVTSEGLRRLAEPYARRILLHHHGTDLERFRTPPPPPADLARLPRPRLGYTGAVDARLDVDLMIATARRHPTASLVVIGPVASPEHGRRLAALPNCHLLGPRPPEAMPAYVGGLDVGLLPYRRNALTDVISPVKALEYLAAGIPCVSSDLPDLRRLAHVIALAPTPAEFVVAVGAAIAGTGVATPAERLQAVAGDDWPERVRGLAEAVDALLQSAPPAER